MEVFEKYKHLQELFNQGYRMNPEIRTFYVRKEDYNNFKLPDSQKCNEDFSMWKVEAFEQTHYLKERLKEMGLTKSPQIELIDENGNRKMKNIMSCNRYGDIITIQYSLDGKQLKNKYGKDAFQQRINPLWAGILCEKYNFTNSVNYPLFLPQIIEKKQNKIQIPTLIATEGYLKAFLPNEIGINVISLGSTTHHSQNEVIQEINSEADIQNLLLSEDEKEEIEYNETLDKWVKKEIHADIASLCVNCSVDRVIVLWDGDCRNISLKDLKKGNDLNKRPNNFYQNAITIARRLNKALIRLGIEKLPKIYFATIKSNEIQGKPKGIDDLFIEFLNNQEVTKKIKYELNNIGIIDESKYFHAIDISNVTTKDKGNKELYEYLLLHNVHEFYKAHKEQITNKIFKFKNEYYQYNEVKQKVMKMEINNNKYNNETTQGNNDNLKLSFKLKPSDFIQIDNQYFKLYKDVKVPVYNYYCQKIKPWSKEMVIQMIGRKNLIDVPFYKGTIFQPMPNKEYKRVIDGFWNTYEPLNHQIITNHFDDITAFLKSVIPNKKTYEMFIEWLAKYVQDPTQKLPAILFVSLLQNTGKTTLLNLLKFIGQENVCYQTCKTLKGRFDEEMNGKTGIIVDEVNFEKNKTIYDIFKINILAKTIPVTKRYVIGEQAPCHQHFMMASNKIDNCIEIDAEDTRFWIIPIPELKPENYIHNLDRKMYEQIGAFVQYLQNYQFKYNLNGQNRLHLSADDIFNASKQALIQESMPQVIKDIKYFLKEQFARFENIEEIKMKASDFIYIAKICDHKNRSPHMLHRQIKQYFPNIEEIETPVNYSFQIYNPEEPTRPRLIKDKGRVFVFKRKDFA